MSNYSGTQNRSKTARLLDFCGKPLPMKKIHIGSIVKRVLRAEGMTQVEFAEKMRFSNKSIYNYLSSETPNTDFLIRATEVLKTDFFELISKKLREENQDLLAEEPAALYGKQAPGNKVFMVLAVDQDQLIIKGSKEEAEQYISDKTGRNKAE